tara:strand:- start:857 stop:1051 length:195 start_codon:yes stop_codon:yes gene_type:complete
VLCVLGFRSSENNSLLDENRSQREFLPTSQTMSYLKPSFHREPQMDQQSIACPANMLTVYPLRT